MPTTTENRPFLTRYAVQREPAPGLPGRYCPESDLWVLDTPEGVIPAALHSGAGMATETRTGGEASDTGRYAVADFGTETAVGGEQSDRTSAAMIAMLATLTEVKPESSVDRTGDSIIAMANEIAVGGKTNPRQQCPALLTMSTVTKVEGEQSDR